MVPCSGKISGAQTVLSAPPRPSPRHAEWSREDMAALKVTPSACRHCGGKLERPGAVFCARACYHASAASPDVVVEFWRRVDRRSDSECWPWTSALSKGGYGRFHYTKGQAHRFSYELHHGQIAAGLLVCHHCDNRRCVNPAHLFLGTHKDNSQDMVSKGRHLHVPKPKGDAHARKLSSQQVAEIRATNGVTNISLAVMYGVNHRTISAIKRGKIWR
jgi:hypothetical protein